MKSYSLLLWFFALVLLTGVFACKHAPDPQPAVCRLIRTTDQLMEANGRLTDELQRTFTYTSAVLTSLAERSMNQDAEFLVERVDQRVVRATGGAMVVTLAYGSATTQPGSATFSRGGKVASTFAMEYGPAGCLSRLVENRIVRPANSLTIERAYTFTYDNAGNLTTERARFRLIDGAVVEQETDFTVGANLSPYANFSERPLLTVVAMSQAVETQPGRFWHLNAPTAYKSYFLTNSGSRSSLRESSTFVTTHDADNKVTGQDQNALLYQLSVPDPITKKNRQVFAYQCD